MLPSKKHEIHGTKLCKISLSLFDTERWISEDRVHTVA